MFDIFVCLSKGTISARVTVLSLVVANPELWATRVLVGHVMLQECLFVVFQDLQALKEESFIGFVQPESHRSTYKVLQGLVQVTVLDEVNF